MMEEKVFPSPAVAGELEGWVEARLHTDGPPREEQNRALQERLTKASGERSVATPIYLFLDPEDERVLVRKDGGLKPGEDPARFAELVADAKRRLED
jgi:hypothetical protein